MDKIKLLVELSTAGLGIIILGFMILFWKSFSNAIQLFNGTRFVIALLLISTGFTIIYIERKEAEKL